MPEYAAGKYRQAQSGFAVVGFPAAALPIDATVMPAPPTLAVIGGGNVPGMTNPKGRTPYTPPVGSYTSTGDLRTRIEPAATGYIDVGAGIGAVKFFQAGLRSNTVLTTARSNCLPYIYVGGGETAACGNNQAFTWLLEMGLIDTLAFSVSNDGSPARLTYTVKGIDLDQGAGTLDTTIVSPSLIATSQGEVLTWQNFSYSVGGTDYKSILNSFSWTVANQVSYINSRNRLSGGDSDKLSSTARDLRPGNQVVTAALGLDDYLPASLVNGSTNATSWGNTVATLGNGTNIHTMTLVNTRLASHDMGGVQDGSMFQFSAPLLAGDITYAYA